MHTILSAVTAYIVLLLTVRILSRRPGAQLTAFEFVLVFLIGGVVILATVEDDRSITNCFCAILAVGLMHRFVADVRQRHPRIAAWLDGTPLVLLKDGEWQTGLMQKLRIQDMDVMASARTKGMKTLDQIEYAVLERNGVISVIQRKD